MMAIKMNDFALLQSLLKFNVDLNQADKEGNSCLLHAINNDLNEVALFLISKNEVDINKSNELNGTTPLMAAAKKNSIVICSAIYNRKNIDVYAKDDEGILYILLFYNSAFLVAVMFNSFEVVKSLIQNFQIDLNEKNDDIFKKFILWNFFFFFFYETALFIASSKGYINIVQFLLNFQMTDINASNGNNVTPLMIACFHNEEEIVRLLCQDERINVDLLDILFFVSLMTMFLFFFVYKNTAMIIAASNGYNSIVQLIAELKLRI
ncbi:hypothetical protein M9Y10_017797 [Tritrichomonas musculus]|uniref:Ankyrin repeat protein n=1 Tax=Tritrichomonas musculus TaxID=1915356 RepID=A0ABR2HW94_9EUKA